MKNQPTYLTAAGAETLQLELEKLTTVTRPDISVRLRAAIQMGDLKENADYITTKEEQAFVEGRILELEEMLRTSVIITEHNNTQEVSIGSTVTIIQDEGSREVYTLVGPAEAEPARGRISHESPIGQALLGKQPGETVTAHTPIGDLTLEVVSIT